VHPVPVILFFGSILIYAALIFFVWPTIYAGRKMYANRKVKPPPAPLAYLHHASLCVFSAVCAGATAWHIAATGEYRSFTAFACTAVPPWMRVMSALFTISKIWEWCDTGVHFARDGKTVPEIGFLHLYHHATTFALFLVVMNFPSTEKAGMLLNGAVHTIMYAHYAWRLPRWARPLITFSQIVQLVYVTWLWAITPSSCPAFSKFPSEHTIEYIAPFLMVPVYTLFFIRFYVSSYLGKKEKGGD
jgi:hypothetical protein